MSDTNIEWTQKSWNPIVGCSIKSAGCTHCYAMPMAARLAAMGVDHYQGLTKKVNGNAVWTGKLAINENALLEPLRRKKPTIWFVNSMGDLFHEDCPNEWIDRVFAVMALCPQHTFQVLTKRSDRMREYCTAPEVRDRIDSEIDCLIDQLVDPLNRRSDDLRATAPCIDETWPLPNVWLGVSVEDQRAADERIPDLLDTPAAIRWLSCEPLLGPVDLGCIEQRGREVIRADIINAMTGEALILDEDSEVSAVHAGNAKLDWIVVGGESGKDARGSTADVEQWMRGLRDQCRAADVPFFGKQNFKKAPLPDDLMIREYPNAQ